MYILPFNPEGGRSKNIRFWVIFNSIQGCKNSSVIVNPFVSLSFRFASWVYFYYYYYYDKDLIEIWDNILLFFLYTLHRIFLGNLNTSKSHEKDAPFKPIFGLTGQSNTCDIIVWNHLTEVLVMSLCFQKTKFKS